MEIDYESGRHISFRAGAVNILEGEANDLVTNPALWGDRVQRIAELQRQRMRAYLQDLLLQWGAAFSTPLSGAAHGQPASPPTPTSAAPPHQTPQSTSSPKQHQHHQLSGDKRPRYSLTQERQAPAPSLTFAESKDSATSSSRSSATYRALFAKLFATPPMEAFPTLVDDTMTLLQRLCCTHHDSRTCQVIVGSSSPSSSSQQQPLPCCECPAVASQSFFELSAYSYLKRAVLRRQATMRAQQAKQQHRPHSLDDDDYAAVHTAPLFATPPPPPPSPARDCILCFNEDGDIQIALPQLAQAALIYALETNYGVKVPPSVLIWTQYTRSISVVSRPKFTASQRPGVIQNTVLWIRAHCRPHVHPPLHRLRHQHHNDINNNNNNVGVTGGLIPTHHHTSPAPSVPPSPWKVNTGRNGSGSNIIPSSSHRGGLRSTPSTPQLRSQYPSRDGQSALPAAAVVPLSSIGDPTAIINRCRYGLDVLSSWRHQPFLRRHLLLLIKAVSPTTTLLAGTEEEAEQSVSSIINQLDEEEDVMMMGHSNHHQSPSNDGVCVANVLVEAERLYKHLTGCILAHSGSVPLSPPLSHSVGSPYLRLIGQQEYRLVWLCVVHAVFKTHHYSTTKWCHVKMMNDGGGGVSSTTTTSNQPNQHRRRPLLGFVEWCGSVAASISAWERIVQLFEASWRSITFCPPRCQLRRSQYSTFFVAEILQAYLSLTSTSVSYHPRAESTASSNASTNINTSSSRFCKCMLCRSWGASTMIPSNAIFMPSGGGSRPNNNIGGVVAPIGRHMANLLVKGLRGKTGKSKQDTPPPPPPHRHPPGYTIGDVGGDVRAGSSDIRGESPLPLLTDDGLPTTEEAGLIWVEPPSQEEDWSDVLASADIQIGLLDEEWEVGRLDSYLLPSHLRSTRLRIYDAVEQQRR